MARRTILAAIGGVMAGALAVTGLVSVATPSDPCESAYAKPMNSTEKLKRYEDCRFDRIDKALSATPSPSATPNETPTATTEPTVTPSETPGAPATPSETPSPSVSQTPTASPTATTPAGLKGWQLTTSNVGLAPFGLTCAGLPAYTGSLKPAAGTTITEKRVTGNLDLSNGGITIERSCIKPTTGDNRALISNDICGAGECVVPAGRGQMVIRDSEFDASGIPAAQIAGSCAFRGIGVLQRNLMRGMGSGICFFGTGYQLDGLAEQNYVTGLRSSGDSHNEAATIRDFRVNATSPAGRSVKFVNNRLNCESGNETGGLFIQTTWVDIVNFSVVGNYLEGGGYNLFLNKAGGNYDNGHAVDNRFRPTGWGPSAVQGGEGWTEWANNYRYDATKPDAKGAVVNP